MALDPQQSYLQQMQNIKPALRYNEGEDVGDWQQRARAQLRKLLGLPVKDGGMRNFHIEWTCEEPTHTEIRFVFESEPQVEVGCHLLLPKYCGEEKLPLIICLQGHSTGMHISLGKPKFAGDEETISGGDRDFARQVIARGQAALVLDQRAFGERGGTEKGPDCHQRSVQALLLGRTLIGDRCHDISCAIDAVVENFPQIDAGKIAVMGNSGGGTATIYAAALDTRIAAAMPSCAFCGYLPSIGAIFHCICNYIPGIMNYFDMGDLGGMVAPRPLIVVNGLKDPIFPIDSAREQFEIAKEVYRAAGAEEKAAHVIGAEGHRFYAADSWCVFDALTGWKKNG